MNKLKLIFPSLALLGIASLGAIHSSPIAVSAEGEEEPSSSEIVSSEPVASSDEENPYVYIVNKAFIGYRENESSSYAVGDESIGSYYLSADGWTEEDVDDIVMTIKGAVTSKLESKVVYIYEYRPTLVTWNGAEVKQNEDKTFTLAKPAVKGSYDLAIYFTKTVIVNPLDLTQLNWSSFLTVQNLMTIGSWVVIVIGIVVIYAINTRYKRRGATTLQEVKNTLSAKVEEVCGKEVAKTVDELLNVVVAKSFNAINEKLDSVNGNVSTLMRCLLVMQENTPEARLAVTKYLAELDTANNEQAEQVKALIESEMQKYKDEQEAKSKAIEEAKKVNEKWKEKAASESEEKDDNGEFGSL